MKMSISFNVRNAAADGLEADELTTGMYINLKASNAPAGPGIEPTESVPFAHYGNAPNIITFPIDTHPDVWMDSCVYLPLIRTQTAGAQQLCGTCSTVSFISLSNLLTLSPSSIYLFFEITMSDSATSITAGNLYYNVCLEPVV
jgi:hypothetical protein